MKTSEPLYTDDENVKWCCSHFETAVFSQKSKPYDPAIPLIGILPNRIENICPQKTWTQMSLAALFIIAKKSGNKCWIGNNCWKQHPYDRILFNHKKKWSMDACYNVEEPQKHYAKWKKPGTKATYFNDST